MQSEDMEIKQKVAELLNNLVGNIKGNVKVFKSIFPDVNVKDSYGSGILELLVGFHDDEKDTLQAVKAAIAAGCDVNKVNYLGKNFAQLAVSSNYSDTFILNSIKYATRHGLDINNQDIYGNTIIHEIAGNESYSGKLSDALEILMPLGLDITKKNYSNQDVYDVMVKCNESARQTKYGLSDFREVYNVLLNAVEDKNNYEHNDFILRNIYAACEGEVILNTDKSLLLLGQEGSGKSTVVNMLASKMKNFSRLDFFESLYSSDELENVLKNSFDNAIDNDKVLVLEDIDKFVGYSSISYELLRKYLHDRELKVIGTTTPSKYTKLIEGTELDNRFDKVELNDAKIVELEQLYDYDYFNILDEDTNDDIKNLLISTVGYNKCHKSNMSNIGILYDVIDKAQGYATMDDRSQINVEDVLRSVYSNNNIQQFNNLNTKTYCLKK